ncbi:MAG: sigma-70 family RNA polymerase sigma factor [Gemmatimonadetes bacterium]|nr:sigma-70 family RNA polymerase sigma factor [Gemmatimonadota bacterium]
MLTILFRPFEGSGMREDALTDEALVDAARDGCEDAFRTLVERYEGRVASVVIRMLGNTPEAEDAGQETFIRFYRGLRGFRGQASVGTYLTRIAINLALTELKKRRRRAIFVPFTPPGREDDTPELEYADPAASSEYDDTADRIQAALNRLKPEFRSVIVLRLMEGYSTKETAEILGLPVGTVLSRLRRSQEKLKRMLISSNRELVHETV